MYPRSPFSDAPGNVRNKVIFLYIVLAAFNAVAWLWALLSFRRHPLLMGAALLAYSLGLRHAVDADHIAAIDNVTRKLMQQGKKPVMVGFLFSLGHSTIVLAGAVLIASTTLAFQHSLNRLRGIGGIVGTGVSSIFLLGIAIANLAVLRSVYRVFVRVRNGGPYVEEDFDLLLSGRGLLARVLRPAFTLIQRSWHMYPLGVLFGLGFDTATEIGLLGLSAAEVSKGLPLRSILVFPVLFAAGMSLVDSTDNILMLGAYGWAFVKPIRKLYYNLTVTLVSVVVALAVGGIEALGLIANQVHSEMPLWQAIRGLNDNFSRLGYLIILIFALSWVISIAFYRWRRFDDLRTDTGPAA